MDGLGNQPSRGGTNLGIWFVAESKKGIPLRKRQAKRTCQRLERQHDHIYPTDALILKNSECVEQ